MFDEETVIKLKEIVERSRSGTLPEGFTFLIDNDNVKAGHWSGEKDEFGEEEFTEAFSYDYSPTCLLEDLLTALGIEAHGV